MKVNVKKEDKNSIAVVIFVIGILLSLSIGIFIAFFKSEKTSLVDVLNLFQTLLLFAICFFLHYYDYFFLYHTLLDYIQKAYNLKKLRSFARTCAPPPCAGYTRYVNPGLGVKLRPHDNVYLTTPSTPNSCCPFVGVMRYTVPFVLYARSLNRL